MTLPISTPEARYAAIVAALISTPAVTSGVDEPRGRNRFGAAELKVGGKIFAMLVRGKLVVKLPRQRVDALIASGDGERFDPRHDGRLMKEWLVVEPSSHVEWLPLAREALAFVASRK
jgi:TfoX/Sxy family transcriptional regulator of competence genes